MARSRALYAPVALVLAFGVVITASPGCGLFECSKDEDDAVVACERVTTAVNDVLAGCGVAALDASIVCGGEVCDRITGCAERASVDACVEAIGTISCIDAQTRAYGALFQCEAVFQKMASSCSSAGGDDDDWDD